MGVVHFVIHDAPLHNDLRADVQRSVDLVRRAFIGSIPDFFQEKDAESASRATADLPVPDTAVSPLGAKTPKPTRMIASARKMLRA
jgi:hypothetical protein